jgi:fatty acid/phospholipid biosynthesis enzyme
MLLGTRGVTLIAHGSSSELTIANAIRTADELARAGIVDSLRQAVGMAENIGS